MDDLISRQAAIGALGHEVMVNYLGSYGLLQAIGVIKRLPSAQQWIPVSERLPEFYGRLCRHPLDAPAGSV